MVLLKFLARDNTVALGGLIGIAATAGISNVALLSILNSAAQQASQGEIPFWHLALFVIAIALYTLTQKYVLQTATTEMESIIHKHRLRITALIRRCDLASLERFGRAKIYATVTTETLKIAQSAIPLVLGVQSVFLIAFTLVYLAWLTVAGLVLTVAILALAIWIFLLGRADIERDYHISSQHENHLFDRLTDLLEGFKEVRINRYRSADLAAHIERISSVVTEIKIRTDRNFAVTFLVGPTSFYVLAAAMIFLLPGIGAPHAEELFKTTTVVLFLVGPVSSVVGSIEALATANAASESVLSIEERLHDLARSESGAQLQITDFERITMHNVTFEYLDAYDQVTYSIGPLNLDIPRGEVLFISGGNGSGKSTLLKLLTALYMPKTGVLKLDDTIINDGNRDAFQNLFSVIFSDFHLFSRTYGLANINQERVAELLAQMGLAGKTRLIDGTFETIDLSTGQRKRLALVVSLLEDRPVYIFDEWAADQDSVSRQKFYDEIIPALNRQGKTIIAVTHDERYFDRCQRRVVMEAGGIVHINAGGKNA